MGLPVHLFQDENSNNNNNSGNGSSNGVNDFSQADFEEFLLWKKAQLEKSKPRETRSSGGAQSQNKNGNSGSVTSEEALEGWVIDPKTGKKYKKLNSSPKELVNSFKKNGKVSLNEVMKYVDEIDKDFNVDDLNSSAEIFMAHLRVPVSDEERAENIRKRKELQTKQDNEYAKQAAVLAEKYDVPEEDIFEDD